MKKWACPENLCKMWNNTFKKVLTTKKPQQVEFDLPQPTGAKSYDLRIVPELADDGSITSFIGVSRDITQLKQITKELKESRDNLEQKVEERTAEIEESYHIVKENELKLKEVIGELERSNQELQSFAYITSHDLQEPLMTVASFTQLLQCRYKGKFDSDADEFMDYTVSASIRMKDMIQGLLDYSSVGTRGNEFKEFNSEEALNIALNNMHSSIEECNAKVTHENLPVITGDEDQITRIFQNLMGNALKFRKEEVQPKIHVSAEKSDNEYVFAVTDKGIGIEKQYIDKIFGVFKRLHTIDEYQGIGLAIVKRIIERHGGHVWVESSFGVGSTFYFTIPIVN